MSSTIHPIYRARRGLTPAVREVLDRGQYAVVGTLNPDGSVHLAPVMYLYAGERILLETSSATRKVRNVSARPHATVLIQDPAANGEAWVSGSGPAEINVGGHARDLGRAIRARYLTDIGEQQVGVVLARYDDVVIAVRPERWMAWDMTALNTTLSEHGISFEHADAWFRN